MEIILLLEDIQGYVMRGYAKPDIVVAKQSITNVEKEVVRIHMKKDAKELHVIKSVFENNIFQNV